MNYTILKKNFASYFLFFILILNIKNFERNSENIRHLVITFLLAIRGWQKNIKFAHFWRTKNIFKNILKSKKLIFVMWFIIINFLLERAINIIREIPSLFVPKRLKSFFAASPLPNNIFFIPLSKPSLTAGAA